MFPKTSVFRPAFRPIAPKSSTVVLFPFVPVTATVGAFATANPSSISGAIGIPRRSASTKSGRFAGTPGLVTTRSRPSSADGSIVA